MFTNVAGSKVIDSIIITYNDNSVWSYGSGREKSNGKTLTLSENESLVGTKFDNASYQYYMPDLMCILCFNSFNAN